MLGLYFFFRGYVKVEIKGRLKERIINGCVRKNVFMWNIKTDDEKVCFNIRRCDIDRVKEAADGAEFNIKDKCGLPYIFGRFKSRYALFSGILVFAVLTVFLSSLVWRINIKGCNVTDVRDIENILADNGVKKWSFKKIVDEDYLEMKIMNGLDTLSWINIDVKGTNVNVKVKERRAIPEMVSDEPADLVASKDGVIHALRVKNGEEAVAVGDTVVKGQLLVSALVEKDGDYQLEKPYTVHSRGEVIARTWYTFDIKQPLVETVCEYTGNEYTRRRVGISDVDINLYFKGIPYESYEIEQKQYGGFLKYETERVREVEHKEYVYTAEDAVKKASDAAESCLPEDVLSTTCITREYTEGEGVLNLHIVFECTENIAVEMPYKERRETTDDSKDSEIQ